MSAGPPKGGVSRTSVDVAKVPGTDACTAAACRAYGGGGAALLACDSQISPQLRRSLRSNHFNGLAARTNFCRLAGPCYPISFCKWGARMHSVDTEARHAAGRTSRKAKRSGRMRSPGPIIADARVWIVGAIVVFVVCFSGARWLPDLMTGSPDNVSTPIAGTSTSTSEVTSLQPSDNSRTVTPNPLIPIVIRRSTSSEASDLPPQTEVSSPSVTVPESVDTVTTSQQLDLSDIENAKRVQQRLIDLGFLYGAADGVWGQRSRRALQEFRAANGIGESDTWDEATQERLLSAPDAKAANTSDISFIGGWGTDVAECRESPIKITARRAEAYGTACEFHSTQREGSNVWRVRAECASKTERWNANIRFTVSTGKLTWSSERGTTAYIRCPMASASR
jgi:hypothetical protein